MATIKSTLDSVWRIFKDARILDDPKVIQSIAAILGKDIKPTTNLHKLMPPRPSQLPPSARSEVLRQLKSAAANGTDIAKLFDRHVLFRLREMLPGNRYPTPRHLVGFLYRIADVQPQMSLIDLACGTGGFLVHHIRESKGVGTCVGIEIDREWVGLVAVNLALHHAQFLRNTPPELYAANAISASSSVVGQTFDRVLLNPPFEEDLQISFLRLGLDLLKPNGHMCLLVSAGTLFSTSKEARDVRRTLVGGDASAHHRLQAVLELPLNVSQPYSGIRTFALLIEPGDSLAQSRQNDSLETADTKEEAETRPEIQSESTQSEAAQPQAPLTTWFLRAKSDGYSGVRARDLTVDPPNLGDLTLIEQLLKDQRTKAVGPSASYHLLTADPGKQIVAASLHRERQSNQQYIIMAQQQAAGDTTTTWFKLPDLTASNTQPGKLDPQLEYLRENDPPVQQLAVTDDGRLLGVCVDIQHLQNDPYDLQVDRFLRERAQERKDDPLEVVGRLHNRERDLLAVIGELRELVEDRRERPSTLPPTVDQSSLRQQQPIGKLSKEQQWVWNQVQELTDAEDGKAQVRYFDANDVIALIKTKTSDATPAPIVVESTLLILEQMGLLTSIQIHTDDNQTYSAYRLCTTYDLWEYTQPNNESPETIPNEQ